VTRREDSNVVLTYAVEYNGWLVLAERVIGDLKLLSPQELSVYLGYVVIESKGKISS